MDIAAVLEEIKYKPGFLRYSFDEAPEERTASSSREETMIPADALPVYVVRFEPAKDALLVRNESDPFHLEENAPVELFVPGPLALTRIDAQVLQAELVRDRVQIFALQVFDARLIRSRKERRFEERLPVRFISLPGHRSVLATGVVAEGRVVNLSLGGMQLLTEEELPVGFEGEFDVRTYAGALLLVGRVVRRAETSNGYAYGIKFLEYDGLTERLLRQHLHAQERRQRAFANEESGLYTSASSARVDRGWSRRRWNR